MKTLKNISVTQSTHSELSEVTSNYLSIINSHLSANPFLIKLVEYIQPKLENLRTALAAVRTNSLVEEVMQLDQARDYAFIVFRDMINAFEKTDDTKEKEAYELLYELLKKVGTTLNNEGYMEQSGRLETMFQEMDKDQYQLAIQSLGLVSRYKKVKKTEQQFKTAYTNRLEEDTKKNYPTIGEARAALTPLINDLIPTLRNVIRVADTNDTLGWVDLINEQTDTVMTQIAARRTRKENEQITE
ncbi:DUF6261 family protein [Aquimarina algicola]|uniref:Uncharacterized protein n=1 Tax=Aquimarina algicola TaxID=2589995 RepID=A0A504JEK0_9FLAO|nr:DUF6261 family protein [Aquimarina algicola]TPN86855.1 hypothetical protein FHK87_04430 [Aquimarina algicola]